MRNTKLVLVGSNLNIIVSWRDDKTDAPHFSVSSAGKGPQKWREGGVVSGLSSQSSKAVLCWFFSLSLRAPPRTENSATKRNARNVLLEGMRPASAYILGCINFITEIYQEGGENRGPQRWVRLRFLLNLHTHSPKTPLVIGNQSQPRLLTNKAASSTPKLDQCKLKQRCCSSPLSGTQLSIFFF